MELVILFSLIAILIGGMGIFAFAIFMVESKTREIALRKVNGASERQIMLLFNRQFMTKVLGLRDWSTDSVLRLPEMAGKLRLQDRNTTLDFRTYRRYIPLYCSARDQLADPASIKK